MYIILPCGKLISILCCLRVSSVAAGWLPSVEPKESRQPLLLLQVGGEGEGKSSENTMRGGKKGEEGGR